MREEVLCVFSLNNITLQRVEHCSADAASLAPPLGRWTVANSRSLVFDLGHDAAKRLSHIVASLRGGLEEGTIQLPRKLLSFFLFYLLLQISLCSAQHHRYTALFQISYEQQD